VQRHSPFLPLLCAYLSAVLLVGLVLNAALGWSWADLIAGLVIAAVAVKEGRDAWRRKGCCALPVAAATEAAPAETDACGCRTGDDCCT
jgi:Co/Zn/Cd efflux system component